MGDLVLGVAKTVVEGTLVKVRSAIDDETKLKASVQRDLVFITGEFQMMQCFLNVTDEEGAKNVAVKAWVRQLRDLAFDLDDCIEFVVHLNDKAAWWWRAMSLPSCMAPTLPLDIAVDNIKELKERVIDVSQRSMRYNITGNSSSSSKPPVIAPALTSADDTLDMLVEAQVAAKRQNGLWDLGRLINREDRDLQVLSLWGTSSDIGMKSIIKKTYDDPETCRNFTCRAWVKLVHPFNPKDFIHSLVAQFFADSCQEQQSIVGVDVMKRMKASAATEEDLMEEFVRQLHNNRYLVILENLSSMVDWHTAKTYLPDIKNGSRLVVSTQQFEIATLCTGHPYNISEIRQFSVDHSVCVLFKEGSQHDGDKCLDEVGDFRPFESEAAHILDILKGVDNEIRHKDKSLAFKVLSVCGNSGVGKSALVRSIYRGQMARKYRHRWGKYAWVNLPRPFDLEEFCRSLLWDLCSITTEAEEKEYGIGYIYFFGRCSDILREHRCLLVIDGLEYIEQWDVISTVLVGAAKVRTIAITSQKSVALHCADNADLVCHIKTSQHDAASGFLKDKVMAPPIAGAMDFDVLVEAKDAAKKQHGLWDLGELIKRQDDDLQVMTVWGTASDHGMKSIMRKSYDDPEICQTFTCRAWVKLMHPLNPHEFIRSLLAQLFANSCQVQPEEVSVDVMKEMNTVGATEEDLMDEFARQVHTKRYLVVLENLSSMVDWDTARTCLPDMKNGSRIIVSTQQFEIASLCTGHPYSISEIRQFSVDHSVCVLFKEGSKYDGDKCQDEVRDSPPFDSETDRIHDDNQFGRCKPLAFQPFESEAINFQTSERDAARDLFTQQGSQGDKGKQQYEVSHRVASPTHENFHLFGRRFEAAQILEILENIDSELEYPKDFPVSFRVMSVWGIAGVGKSYLVRSIFHDQMKFKYSHRWSKQAWANVPHPFNLRELCQSLLLGLSSESGCGNLKEYFGMSLTEDPIKECRDILREHRCLIVIDHLLSIEDWGTINAALRLGSTKSYTVVITNEESIAIQCAAKVFNIRSLQPDAALQLYKDQIKSTPYTPSDEEEKLALVKCGGLPKVITAVCGYYGNRRSTWRLNDDFIDILKSSLYCGDLQGLFIWMQSYFRSCPDFLKPCVFYLPIFPPNYNIRRRRLLRRWIAEGYCRGTISAIAEQNAENSFEKLMSLSMVQEPPQAINLPGSGIKFCQINGFFHEYITSQPKEDNMVFAFGDAWKQDQQFTGRHLTIRSDWDRAGLFELIDFSQLRSLTVFGEWKSFFISKKMQMLRVLDLEDTTSDVSDEEVEKIVDQMSRLKFLSLRGCRSVSRLPDSLGNLKQLETLDVRHTSITMLPQTMSKLQGLHYIRAGSTVPTTESPSIQPGSYRLPKFRRRQYISAHLGVKVPSGVGKLTALDTLGVVNIGASGGKAFLKELKNLTQVRKLGVSGINRQNIADFVSAISALSLLDSLYMRLEKNQQSALCSVNDISEPQEIYLTSLKIHGDVDNLSAWMEKFTVANKLDLEVTILTQEMIDTLAGGYFECVRLCVKPIEDGTEHSFSIGRNSGCLIQTLEIDCSSKLLLTFEENAMQDLKVLKVHSSSGSQISELAELKKLEQVWLIGSCDEALKQEVKRQLAEHPSEIKPVLMPEEVYLLPDAAREIHPRLDVLRHTPSVPI